MRVLITTVIAGTSGGLHTPHFAPRGGMKTYSLEFLRGPPSATFFIRIVNPMCIL